MGFVVSSAYHNRCSYLYQTPSGYIFRLRIPKHLQELVGKTEFRYSLRSGFLREAKPRAKAIASYIQQLFTEVSLGMKTLSREDINGLVLQYIKETLANDERCRATGKHHSLEFFTTDGSNMGKAEADKGLEVVSMWLKNNDYDFMKPIATQKYLQDFDFTTESDVYKELLHSFLKAYGDILRVRGQRGEGNYAIPDEDIIPMLKEDKEQFPQETLEAVLKEVSSTVKATLQEQSTAQAQEKEAPAVLFSEVRDRYVAEAMRRKKWGEKTKSENLAIFRLFLDVYGDMPISDINRDLMEGFIDTILRLPPNMNKKKEYQGLTVYEIIELEPKETLSTNSVNKYIRRISALMGYAVKIGAITSNPTLDMQIKSDKRADEERPTFSTEDLIKVFNTPEYQEGKHTKSVNYWSPLIAIYSGARIDEICQLHLEDIRMEKETWVFDINANTPDKKLKNKNSKRLIPIHPHLIDLGLLAHVDRLRQAGFERLFPELRRERDGYSQSVSKWFSRYKARYGVAPVFHSFRHTVSTQLKYKRIDKTIRCETLGHAVEGETDGRYGKRYTPDILLKEAISKLDYSEVWERVGNIPPYKENV